MLALKYLLMGLGVALLGSATALVAYDVYVATQLRRLLRRDSLDPSGSTGAAPRPSRPIGPVSWRRALQIAGLGIVPPMRN